MSEPLIREARLADLPALADIERDADTLFLQTDMPEIGSAEPTDSAALAALLGEGAFWVAERDGAPVGFLAAGTRHGQYIILQISVARAGQGRGVGARLMETALTDHLPRHPLERALVRPLRLCGDFGGRALAGRARYAGARGGPRAGHVAPMRAAGHPQRLGGLAPAPCGALQEWAWTRKAA